MRGLDLPDWRGDSDDPARVIATIDAWAESPALWRLVEAFGGAPAGLAGDHLLAMLDGFSERWDFRGGHERDQSAAAAVTAAQAHVVAAQAQELGLSGRFAPGHPRYDTVLMTGGMVRAGIVKPRFVRRLLDEGLAAREIVFLGAFREFSPEETVLAAHLGVPGHDEFDAMTAGIERAFGPLDGEEVTGESAESPAASWRQLEWQWGELRLGVLAAPSSAPGVRRANTADTLRFWAERWRAPEVGSVLLVTTPIYLPYQGAVAVDVLGLEFGLAVETIGVAPWANDLGQHSQPFDAGHHLQELRSAVRAMRSLRERLVARLAA